MDKIVWAGIVHNILMLKIFAFKRLKAISCGKDAQIREVLSELMAGDFIELDLGRKLYCLTSDLDKRFDLLEKVREIERKRV